MKHNSNADLFETHKKSPETKPLELNEEIKEHVPFESSFCYLGSIMDFMLVNTPDIECRMSKASKAMGSLSFIWNTDEEPLETTKIFFLAVPMILAL